MNNHLMPCDRNRLRLLIDDQLTLSESRTTELHLAECPTCRRDLEWLAADPHWWRDASEFLRNDNDDVSKSMHESTSSSSSVPERTSAPSLEPSTFDVILDYLQPADDPTLLGRLGPYDILEIVGRGGMGIVLKGFDKELNRHIAIKVLAPHFAGSAAARQRFAREAQAAAAIVHPHVIPIHMVDVTGPLPYLVMPLVSGESLHERLQLVGPMSLRDVLRIGLQTAEGLAAAHAQGLVHRDIKPANILLEKGVHRVLLTDFGLARAVDDATLTRSGVIAGTPQFMSPEQARGDAVDCRSDLFSLGSVLYSMCTGFPPFRAETWMGVLRRITDSGARPVREINPDIPAWLETLIQQLHAKQPAARPQSAAEVARLLEQCLAHVQQPFSNPLPASLLPSAATPQRRNRTRIITMVMAIFVCAALIIWGINNWNTEPAATDHRAEQPNQTQVANTEPVHASVAAAAIPDDELQWNDSTFQEIGEIHMMLRSLEESSF